MNAIQGFLESVTFTCKLIIFVVEWTPNPLNGSYMTFNYVHRLLKI